MSNLATNDFFLGTIFGASLVFLLWSVEKLLRGISELRKSERKV